MDFTVFLTMHQCIMMLNFWNPAQIIITVITLFHRLDRFKSSEPFADTTSCSLLLKDHKESLTSLLTALKCQLQAKNQSVKFSARTLYMSRSRFDHKYSFFNTLNINQKARKPQITNAAISSPEFLRQCKISIINCFFENSIQSPLIESVKCL